MPFYSNRIPQLAALCAGSATALGAAVVSATVLSATAFAATAFAATPPPPPAPTVITVSELAQAESATEAESEAAGPESAPTPEALPAEAGSDTGSAGLHLNDGARWAMDEHTRAMVATINETVAATAVTSIDDVTAAAATLRDQLQTLVAGCTMEGPAHDQLHVFLGAWVPALARFRDAPDTEAGNRELEALRQLLDEYGRHFE